MIHIGLMFQKFKNLEPRLRGPILVPPNFVKFYLFFILAYAENVMSSMNGKKIEFWQPHCGGKPQILVSSNFGQIFFFFYICISQTLHVSS